MYIHIYKYIYIYTIYLCVYIYINDTILDRILGEHMKLQLL